MKLLLALPTGCLAASLRLYVPAPAPGPGGPAPQPKPADTLWDELVDQVNPEFKLADLNGQGCVELGEWKSILHTVIADRATKTTQNCKKFDNAVDKVSEYMDEVFEKRKSSKASTCLNRREYKKAMAEINGNNEGLCREFFMLQDENCDGKISQTEFWHYIDKFMTNGDISHGKALAMWKAINGNAGPAGAPGPAPAFIQVAGPAPGPAPGPGPAPLVPLPDTTGRFVTIEEFCTAGPKYNGDGPGK